LKQIANVLSALPLFQLAASVLVHLVGVV